MSADIEYLARWRMAIAKDAPVRDVKSPDRIADEIDYESASAFSTAFGSVWAVRLAASHARLST